MSAVWEPEPRERPTQESVTSAAHLPQPPKKNLTGDRNKDRDHFTPDTWVPKFSCFDKMLLSVR